MHDPEWWRGAVIYQVYPRSFADGDGDGVGDLPGLITRLDYLADLGVDALWLCPVYPSPGCDFGYDVSDHRAIDPLFGSEADLDRLIAGAHARGLRVLLDLVAGHTSDRHPWFAESRRGGGGRDDWYVWADPRPDGTPPNNWLAVFGGPAWRWEPRRRQYYLHHFLPEQPALNLHNPAVCDAVLDIARHWLDRGVDGFRIDAIDFLAHDPRLLDNPAAPSAGRVPAKLFGMQRHLHDMMHAAARPFLGRLRTLLDLYPGAVTLGEVSSQEGAFGRVAAATEGGDALHMAYTLRPLRGGFDRPTLQGLLADAIAAARTGWPCWSFSNHDVERAASRWAPPGLPPGEADPRVARLLLALLLTLPGSACLYQGEELGLPDAQLAEHEIRDPFGRAFWPEFRGRDGSRTPMPWDATLPQAGFTAGIPWLPIPAAHRALNAAVQAADPDSTLAATRVLLRLRRALPALRHGVAEPLDLPPPLFGFTRTAGVARVALAFNLSAEAVSMPGLPPLAPWGYAVADPALAAVARAA